MRLYSVPFSYSNVKEHVCLLKDEVNRSSAKDCVINTLYFMKMFKRGDAEMYARIIHDEKMNGLNDQEIIHLIFQEFTSISKTQDAIIKIKQLSFKELNKLMDPNTCTYVSFLNKGRDMRHAVVVFKDKDGNLGIYDGQTHDLVNTEETMKLWFEAYSAEELNVLYESDKRIRKSGRKDEKQPLKRIRVGTYEKSNSKSKSKSKTKSNRGVVTEPTVKKIKSQTRKREKGVKQTDLENKRQKRISQKITFTKENRDNLLKIKRLEQLPIEEHPMVVSESK